MAASLRTNGGTFYDSQSWPDHRIWTRPFWSGFKKEFTREVAINAGRTPMCVICALFYWGLWRLTLPLADKNNASA